MSELDYRADSIAKSLEAHDTQGAVSKLRNELYNSPETIRQVIHGANSRVRSQDSERIELSQGYIIVRDPFADNEAVEVGPLPTPENPRPVPTYPPIEVDPSASCGPDSEADDRDPDAQYGQPRPCDRLDPQFDPRFDPNFPQQGREFEPEFQPGEPPYEQEQFERQQPIMPQERPNPFDLLRGLGVTIDLFGGRQHERGHRRHQHNGNGYNWRQ